MMEKAVCFRPLSRVMEENSATREAAQSLSLLLVLQGLLHRKQTVLGAWLGCSITVCFQTFQTFIPTTKSLMWKLSGEREIAQGAFLGG